MKIKIITFLIAGVILLSNLVVFYCEKAKSEETSSLVFFDDFNDNSLDNTKWTTDVTGPGNSFEETNNEATFITYGHEGAVSAHSFLYSNIFTIEDWNSITFSGKWKFTDAYTAEMQFRIYDADDTDKAAGVHYATWTNYKHEHIRYHNDSINFEEVLRTVPRSYVSFQIVLFKDKIEYWEEGSLVKTFLTDTLADTTDFKIRIGGWDWSSYYQHIYFDDIQVRIGSFGGGNPPIITIYSPQQGAAYDNNFIWLNVSADKTVNNWYYSLDGSQNVTFTPYNTISVTSGHHELIVYAVDSSGKTGSASVEFDVTLNTAIVSVSSTMYGVSNTVGGLMSVQVLANTTYNFVSERLYVVDKATNDSFDLYTDSLSGQSVDKAIVVSVLFINDSNYKLYYEAVDTQGGKVIGIVDISVKNAKFDIVYVDTTPAERIYTQTKSGLNGYSFTDETDYFPEDERGSFVYVTVVNYGRQGGAAKLELILPDYLKNVGGNYVKYIYLNAYQSKCYTFYVLLTKYDAVHGWEPSDPSVFPSNKLIPIEARITHFPSYSVVDTLSANIPFKLGPIFRIEPPGSNYVYIFNRDPNNPDDPYDGDGDNVLEAAEGHHFNLKYVNIGDEPANLQSFTYLEVIPCDTTQYWINSPRNYGYISNANAYYVSDTFSWVTDNPRGYYIPDFWENKLTNIFGNIWPQGTTNVPGTTLMKYMYNGRIDWWPDDVAFGYHPPANYTGDVISFIQLCYYVPTDLSKPYWYYSPSINSFNINVEALEKTFTPASFTLKDGDIEVDIYSVDVEKNTTQFKVTNNNEYVYFEYKLDSFYDSNPDGYKWYHTIPPDYKFNVFADARDPNTFIPHMKAVFGVKWSVWANELKLGMMTLEAVVNIILGEVTGGAVEVEFADTVMGITNTLLQLLNAYESISQGVPPNIRINGVTIDMQELADQGLNRAYFTRVANGDIDAGMITTLVGALWENDELKDVVGREILKAIANKLGLKTLYDLMIDEDAQEDAFDDLLEKFLGYLTSTERLTEDQAEEINDVVGAAKTFMDLGEWAYNNLAAIGEEHITINILDPPGNFTTDYETQTTNYFGGPYTDESTVGEGDVTITLSGDEQVQIKGDYSVEPENLPFDVDKIEQILISVTGEKQNNEMIGTVNVEIIPKPQYALDCFVAFRNPLAQQSMISSNFESLQSYSAVTQGDKIIIIGTGVLRTSDDDTSVNNNLKIDETGLQSSIQRTGNYIEEIDGKNQLSMKFKPVYGVALDDTSLSVEVEEGAQFDSNLPYEQKGNVNNLDTLPDEITIQQDGNSYYLNGSVEETKPEEPKKADDNTMLIIAGIIIVLLLIVIIFFIVRRKHKKE